jgi:hypothetical protein
LQRGVKVRDKPKAKTKEHQGFLGFHAYDVAAAAAAAAAAAVRALLLVRVVQGVYISRFRSLGGSARSRRLSPRRLQGCHIG